MSYPRYRVYNTRNEQNTSGVIENNNIVFGHAQVCATHRRETLRAPSADLAKNRSQSTNLVDLGTSNGFGTQIKEMFFFFFLSKR